jgi:hypothetical protein
MTIICSSCQDFRPPWPPLLHIWAIVSVWRCTVHAMHSRISNRLPCSRTSLYVSISYDGSRHKSAFTALSSLHTQLSHIATYIQSRITFSTTMSYNSLLLIPASNVASPIVTPVIPVGSPMVVQLQVEAAPSSSLCQCRTSSHDSSHRPSSSHQPSSALYLPQLSSALSHPHPSSSLCLPKPPLIPVPAVIHASPLSEACIPVVPSREVASAYEVGYSIGFPSRCPLCPSNSSNNRAKVGFKRQLQRLLGIKEIPTSHQADRVVSGCAKCELAIGSCEPYTNSLNQPSYMYKVHELIQ